MVYFKYLILLILIVSFACKGAEVSIDSWAYKTAYKLCSNPKIMDTMDIVSQSALETVTSKVVIDSLVSIMKKDFRITLNSKLESMFASQGYYEALNDCYGDNKYFKELFHFSLVSADISGKFFGGIFVLRTLGGINAFSKLKKPLFYIARAGVSVGVGFYIDWIIDKVGLELALEKDPILKEAYLMFENGEITKDEIGDVYLDKQIERFDKMIEFVDAHITN